MRAEEPKRTPERSPGERATGVQPELTDGRIIGGRYRLVAPLDRRHQIWQAVDTDARPLALKTGPTLLIEHEQGILSQLEHPGIVELVATLETASGPFLVLEYLAGGDLVSLAGMPPQHWLDSIEALVAALAHIHSQGIVHRDLKARHVRFDDRGRVRLIDFGSAMPVGSPWTPGGSTALMVDPRRGARPVAPADDIYALACLLHEMLHGRLPAAGPARTLPAWCGPLVELVDRVLAAPEILQETDLTRFATVIKWMLSEQRTTE